MQTNKYTIQTLTELISNYGKLVEHYDHKADPISQYFMEKIQNALTLQSSLELIYEEKQESQNSY